MKTVETTVLGVWGAGQQPRGPAGPVSVDGMWEELRDRALGIDFPARELRRESGCAGRLEGGWKLHEDKTLRESEERVISARDRP